MERRENHYLTLFLKLCIIMISRPILKGLGQAILGNFV